MARRQREDQERRRGPQVGFVIARLRPWAIGQLPRQASARLYCGSSRLPTTFQLERGSFAELAVVSSQWDNCLRMAAARSDLESTRFVCSAGSASRS